LTQAEEILRGIKLAEAKEGQGRLKIFMGMVAGVGKTYAMLKAAHALKESGADPVVGYIETHSREETEALVGGLNILPRKKIPYKDVILEEFDIDALLDLKPKPKLVLIDELAHTNVPGSRHHKRWQDVMEILGQGIDVFTTLNVQHVESRADTISGLTGVRIHELVPDSVIDRADEIVLIDLIPDEIVSRLKQGKIYAKDKVDAATQNFFKVSNLTALREISLRLMAERVDHELKDLSVIQGVPLNIKTHHKIMVAIFSSPYSESLIRYTRKLAYALNCHWFAGYVNTDRNMSEKEKELIDQNIELVKQLGGEVMSTQNESVADGLIHLAQQFGASQIVVGKSERGGLLPFLSKPLHYQLVDRAHGIDINVISPTKKVPIHRGSGKKKKDFDFDWRMILTTTGYVANLTIMNAVLVHHIHYRAIGMIYLMGITVGALFIKSYSVGLASLLGGLCWNVFFLPPRFTFIVEHHEDWILLALYGVAGVVIGTFTSKLKAKEEVLRSEGERATQLYSITKELSSAEDLDTLVSTVASQVDRIFGCPASIFLKPHSTKDFNPGLADGKGNFIIPAKEEYALHWVVKNRLPAGRFTDTLPLSEGYYVPLLENREVIGIIAMKVSSMSFFGHERKLVLDAIARQLSSGIQREWLHGELRSNMVSEESERIYKTLLNSVSHEMRTPLAAIKGFASAMTEEEVLADKSKVIALATEVTKGVERLDQVVQNLLDMSRLETGNLKLNLDYADIQELIEVAISRVRKLYGEKQIIFKVQKDLPFVYLDYVLIEQSVENIIRNAFIYTPVDAVIEIDVIPEDKYLVITIADNGPGIKIADPNKIFQKFFRERPEHTGGLGLGLSICKAIIELHRGTITVANIKGKGASFTIRLPRELDRELILNG
jgi:two-component system sensor histidine kinase KdpD